MVTECRGNSNIKEWLWTIFLKTSKLRYTMDLVVGRSMCIPDQEESPELFSVCILVGSKETRLFKEREKV